VVVHLIDGTYELFRHFYGLRRFNKGKDRPYGAVVGVLQTVLQIIGNVKGSASRGHGGTYLGVATDHVIESFRNRLWAGYKTGDGIEPALLALVGDAADGYPGIAAIGAKTAAQLVNRYGKIENFPRRVLGEQREFALLFKKLATLRTDAPLFKKVETLRWRGATPAFAKWAKRMEAPRLLERCKKAAGQ
jgi:5'-3' exonuclease